MVLALKQMHRPMEHKREPRIEPMHIWSRMPRPCNGDRKVSSTNGVGKIKYPYAKNTKQKQKHESLAFTYTKINKRWIKDISIRP